MYFNFFNYLNLINLNKKMHYKLKDGYHEISWWEFPITITMRKLGKIYGIPQPHNQRVLRRYYDTKLHLSSIKHSRHKQQIPMLKITENPFAISIFYILKIILLTFIITVLRGWSLYYHHNNVHCRWVTRAQKSGRSRVVAKSIFHRENS